MLYIVFAAQHYLSGSATDLYFSVLQCFSLSQVACPYLLSMFLVTSPCLEMTGRNNSSQHYCSKHTRSCLQSFASQAVFQYIVTQVPAALKFQLLSGSHCRDAGMQGNCVVQWCTTMMYICVPECHVLKGCSEVIQYSAVDALASGFNVQSHGWIASGQCMVMQCCV